MADAEPTPVFQPPAPDFPRLLEVWTTWKTGDELPGRTLADLKIASVDVFLEAVASDSEAAAAQYDSLLLWNRGKSTPEETLAALEANDFGPLIAAAVDALVADGA